MIQEYVCTQIIYGFIFRRSQLRPSLVSNVRQYGECTEMYFLASWNLLLRFDAPPIQSLTEVLKNTDPGDEP